MQNDKLEKITQEVFNTLLKKKLTISFCESATGGMLSSLICNFENASKVFKGSLITYCNEAKHEIAEIDNYILDKYGAISYETAYWMVRNVNQKFKTNVSVSVTGNASSLKPIEGKHSNEYYVGICKNKEVFIFHVQLKDLNDRNKNRAAICWWIFEQLAIILAK